MACSQTLHRYISFILRMNYLVLESRVLVQWSDRRTIVPDNQLSCQRALMDYVRLADESRNLVGGELQPIGRDYDRSVCITSHASSANRRIISACSRRDYSRVRSFGDPGHELIISSLGEISRFRVWLTHDFHCVRIRAKRTRCCVQWLLFRAREPRRRVCPPRCDAFRRIAINLRFALPKSNCHLFQRQELIKDHGKICIFSIKFISSLNIIEKIRLKRQSLFYNSE